MGASPSRLGLPPTAPSSGPLRFKICICRPAVYASAWISSCTVLSSPLSLRWRSRESFISPSLLLARVLYRFRFHLAANIFWVQPPTAARDLHYDAWFSTKSLCPKIQIWVSLAYLAHLLRVILSLQLSLPSSRWGLSASGYLRDE